MTINSLKYIFMIGLVAWLLVWATMRQDIYCVIDGGEDLRVNGYYGAIGGLYLKQDRIGTVPDFFDVYAMMKLGMVNGQSNFVVAHDKTGWGLYVLAPIKEKLYANTELTSGVMALTPPASGWIRYGEENVRATSTLQVSCTGSLADSPPPTPPSQQSNIQVLLSRPVTTVLCATLLTIAYLLWAWRTDVSSVSFSYESVVLSGEYWRAVSASFAHFDVMHIGFNVMSLYQLGELEIVYGSAAFAYLNVDLVAITMVLCCCMYHVLIHKFNRHNLVAQQAVGYSCVLFAWMVAAAVRMDKYCPLFFMPSLCFATHRLPLPFSFPVNFGPFVLLLVTKLILPRSSLTGHLSGIVIGFPLAWNLLGWMKPPVLLTAVAVLLMTDRRLWVWRLPGFELRHSGQELQEFVSPWSLNLYRLLRAGSLFGAVLLAVSAWLYLQGGGAWWLAVAADLLVSRVSLLLLAISAAEAVRCSWLTDLRAAQMDCALIVALTGVFSLCLCMMDSLAVVALLVTQEASTAGMGGTLQLIYQDASSIAVAAHNHFVWALGVVFAWVLLEVALCAMSVLALQQMEVADAWLRSTMLDKAALRVLLRGMGLSTSSTQFDGRGNAVGTEDSASPVAVQPSPLHSQAYANIGANRDEEGGFGSHQASRESEAAELKRAQDSAAVLAGSAALARFAANLPRTAPTDSSKKSRSQK
jgi:membrane associated rhomboid family serine protease